MIRISREALVPYRCEQMFDLVMDVDSYPQFLRYCVGAEVLRRSDSCMDARLHLARGPLRQSFATRNTWEQGRSIHLALLEGPFKSLQGDWRFDPLSAGGCRVSLRMSLQPAGALRLLITPMITEVANQLLDAVVERARQLYGGTGK